MRRPCPKANADCKYVKCFSDKHHPDWPKTNYTTSLERQYRETRALGNYICRAEHDEIHATQDPPPKPTPAEMVRFIAMSEQFMPELEDAA